MTRSTVLAALMLAGVAAAAQERRLERAQAPRSGAAARVALCVGNDRYPGMPLRNAANDARAMAAALGELGFQVETRTDVGGADLERAVVAFAGRLAGADVGFFFYAGHGVQIDGVNYLLPVDFSADDEVAAKHRGQDVEELRERMERSGSRVNVLVLDACRDNPWRFTRSAGRGLAPMNAARGTLVALATGPGQTASDNARAANGLFTEHLLKALREPLRLQDVFERTKAAVAEASGQKQRPWVHADLVGDVYLRAPAASAAAGAEELEFWRGVTSLDSEEAYRKYLESYPQGHFKDLAAMKIRRLGGDPGPTHAMPEPVRAGEGGSIEEPRKVRDVRPVYPELAVAARVQGLVILECTISPEGEVVDVSVLRGIPLLDEAAKDAVWQWRYTPTLLNGVAVPVIMTVTVNFSLK